MSSLSPIPPVTALRPASSLSSPGAKPPAPAGVAGVPDQLPNPEAAPSVFKKILFDPFVGAVLWVLRAIFQFFDMLRRAAFSGSGASYLDDEQRTFFSHLQGVPPPPKILAQFDRLFSPEEKDAIYRTFGENSSRRLSWSERLFGRSATEDIALGYRMAIENPYLLRDFLLKKMER